MYVSFNAVNTPVNPAQIEDELDQLDQLAQEYAQNPKTPGLEKKIDELQAKIAAQCEKLPKSEQETLKLDLKYLNLFISRLKTDIANGDSLLTKSDINCLNILIHGRFDSYLTKPDMRDDQSITQDLDLMQAMLMDANNQDASQDRIDQDTDLLNQLFGIADKKISGLFPSIQGDVREFMNRLKNDIDAEGYNEAYGCILDLKQIINVAMNG